MSGAGGVRTVLVVDDNLMNRKLCGHLLQGAGYAVVEAADGAAGVERARAERPALVLMDVQMPVLDGIEAMRRLRADPATGGIPVVALTSSAMKGDRERLLGAGFDEYVSKPIDIDRFLEVVRRLAGG